MTLEGLEVLLLQPDFASAPKLVGNYKTDRVDLSEAPRLDAYVGDHPLHSFTHKFKFTDRATAAILEDFMFDRSGKWQPFWLPSWQAELNPLATIADGGTTLSITPVNYATVFDPTHANVARLGHYIFLLHYDGTMLIRKVTGVSGSSPEVLTLNAAVTREFKLGQFAVGFVYCVTAISDELALTFSGIETSEADLGVTEEPFIDDVDDAPETPTIPDLLVADFDMDVDAGDPPLDVEFTDTSTGTPTVWLWNFGDGSATSALQNPSHTFSDDGIFRVRLTVTDASGNQSTITKTVTVNSPAPPAPDPLLASFTATPDSGDASLVVAFTDTSTGDPNGWLWDFGDSTPFSGEQNPSHTYVFPGIYTVKLTIRDINGGESVATDQITVTVAPPITVPSCDSGATYDVGTASTGLSCAGCCTMLDAMAVDDMMVWVGDALANCLGLTAIDGMSFEYDGKTFGIALDPTLNSFGSATFASAQFFDVVRIA